MRKYVYGISLAVLFAATVLLAAQADQDNPFIGTWKLNLAKSKISPGPAPKSETVTITDGSVTVEEVTADDKSVKWSFSPSADAAVPVQGIENLTVSSKRSGNTVDDTWKTGNSTETGHGVVSKNGKTMRYTMTGTNPQGQPVHNFLIFEKE